jgi:uracil phosphoribosyltransferase
MNNLHVVRHPLVQHKLTLLRDERTDGKLFREVLKELTVLLAYECTADLTAQEGASNSARTPLGPFTPVHLRERIALVPILRSGLGLIDRMPTVSIVVDVVCAHGHACMRRCMASMRVEMLSLLPTAGILHLGIFRERTTKQPVEYYSKLPPCSDHPLYATLPGTSIKLILLYYAANITITYYEILFLVMVVV